MSKISRWSYKATATVRPFLHRDLYSQDRVYGPPYEIKCSFVGKSESLSDIDGADFTSRLNIYTEDPRPKPLDMIKVEGSEIEDPIRLVLPYDMKMFNDTDDFLVIT